MSNYSSLKATIDANVKANNNQEITGAILNSVLNAVVNSMGAKYQYAGVATPDTDPGTPDQNLFYIATTPGSYTNFGGIVVASGECVVLKGTGSTWSKEDTGIDLVSVSQNTSTGHTDITIGSTTTPVASVEEVSQLGQEMRGKVDVNSYNLLNPNTIQSGHYIADNGYIYANSAYSISDYIPTRGNNIQSTGYVAGNIGINVYDSNFNRLRTLTRTSSYTYEEGDAYVRITFTTASVGVSACANYGDTLNAYVVFNPIDGYLADVKETISEIEGETNIINEDEESATLILSSAAIDSNGDVVSESGGIAGVWKIKVTPFAKYYFEDVRAIVGESGVFFKYAWYSSYDIINAGTLISGESATAPFDTTISGVTLTPPNGALALVVSAYTTYHKVHKAQDTANSMSQLYVKRDLIENSFKKTTQDILNGNRKIFGTAYSFKYFGISPHPSGVSPYENNMNLTGMGWCYFGPFNPNNDEIIHIEFDVTSLITTGDDIAVYVAKKSTGSGASMQLLQKITDKGHYNVILDPTYYRVHKGFEDTFFIWLYKQDVQISTCIIENMMIYSVVGGGDYQTINGTTAKELFKSTDENLGYLNEKVEKKDYLIAPNGNKYDYGVDNNGNLIAIPVIPSKAAFFGNSLMFGNVYFGMDASNIDNDFYAKVNAYIATLNPNYVANRYSSVPFETIGSLDNIDSVIAATIANLQGDEDLVVIQAGDNTTDAQAATIMPTSCMRLLAAIRTKCPNARICWPAIWYATTLKMNNVRNACDRYGAIVASIGELNVPENQGTIGSIIDYGQGNSVQNTLNNVSNLVENTSNNITVTFTYSGGTYTQTIDVDSYSLDGTTLTYTGRYRISTVGAGHPGNRGMKAIANKILYAMGISDDENAYPLD